jgi:hypothetical protein
MAAPLPPRLRRLIAAASRMYFSSPAEDNWWLNIATAGNNWIRATADFDETPVL